MKRKVNDLTVLFETFNRAELRGISAQIKARPNSKRQRELTQLYELMKKLKQQADFLYIDDAAIGSRLAIKSPKHRAELLRDFRSVCFSARPDTSPISQFHELMKRQTTLSNRGLSRQALTITIRARRLAKAYLLIHEEALAITREIYHRMRLSSTAGDYEVVRQLYREKQVLAEEIELYDLTAHAINDLTALSAEKISNKKLHAQKLFAEFDDRLKHPFPNSTFAEHRRLNLVLCYAIICGDKKLEELQIHGIHKLFDTNPELADALPKANISRYAHHLALLLNAPRFIEGFDLYDRFQTLLIPPEYAYYAFEQVVAKRIPFFINILLIENLEAPPITIAVMSAEVKKISEQYDQFKHKLVPLHSATILLNIANYYLIIGDYDQAQSRYDELLYSFAKTVQEDFMFVANLLQSICQHHLGHRTSIERVYDNYRKRFELKAIDKAVIRIIRAYFQLEQSDSPSIDKTVQAIDHYEQLYNSDTSGSIASLFGFHHYFRKLLRDRY